MPTSRSRIPSIQELFETPAMKTLVEHIHPSSIMSTVRIVLDEMTGEVQHAATEWAMPSVTEVADRIIRRLGEHPHPTPKRTINATGRFFYSEFGGAPLAETAARALGAWSQDYFVCVEEEDRTDLFHYYRTQVEAILCELTGAEAATVVSCPSAALRAAVSAVAPSADGKILLARSQMFRKSPSYRLPELIDGKKNRVLGVGSANRLRLSDYRKAIAEHHPAAILSVDPTGLSVPDVACQNAMAYPSVPIDELTQLAHEKKLPVVHDLTTATLADLTPYGIESIPTVASAVTSGADLVLFDTRLLGTPGCAMMVGRQDWVRRVELASAADPASVGLSTLSALAAILPLFKTPAEAIRSVPVLQLLVTPSENLENRARRLAPQLEALATVAQAEVATVDFTGPFGLPTWTISIEPDQLGAAELGQRLLAQEPAVQGRIEDNRLVLDLRTVFPRHDINLVDAFEAASEKTKNHTENHREK